MNMADHGMIREGEACWTELRAPCRRRATVHCVVTSPPYWGQRDYGLGEWEGGDPECDHAHRQNGVPERARGRYRDQRTMLRRAWAGGVCGRCGARSGRTPGIGQEPTLGEHIDNLVGVMREVRRVLRDDGTVWLNYGDALVSKQLLGMPWRVAFALQDDGWWLRSAIVWHKPSPMPESVRDRPTSAYEMIFLLAKRPRYFYDAEAIREPAKFDARMDGTGFVRSMH